MTQNAFPLFAWNNLIVGATVAVSTEDSEFPAENLQSLRPVTPWKGTGSSEQTVTFTFGQAEPVTCFGISGHNLNTIGAAGVVLQYLDGTWKDCHAAWTPADDKTWFAVFPSQSSTSFRLKIPAGYAAPPAIGVLFVGTYFYFPSWVSGGWDPDKEEVTLAENISRNGYFLGTGVRYSLRKISMEFDLLSDAFVQNYLKPWWAWAKGRPFFVVPEIANHPTEVYYMVLDRPSFSAPWNRSSRKFSLDLKCLVE